MSRIGEAFERCRAEGRKAFIPFLAAGDPDLPATAAALQILDRAGADVIELGIPFSDPIADGPIIQASYQRALEGSVSLEKTLAYLGHLRLRAPLLLFTYLNPLLQLGRRWSEPDLPAESGLHRLAREAAQAGVGGVLVSDLTPEEAARYRDVFQSHALDTVFLVAPTTTEIRLPKILSCCSGFVYLIARTGVTGRQTVLTRSIENHIDAIRRHCSLPVAIGFGMRTPDDVRRGCAVADGVVVGSAIVEALHRCVGRQNWELEFARTIGEFVEATRNGGSRRHSG